MARVVVLPATFQTGCNRQLRDSLIHIQREVDIGFNAVRAKDATDAGAHMVEPIRLPYRANTKLNASTDERHALAYSIQARGMQPYRARGIIVLDHIPCSTHYPSTLVLPGSTR